MRETDDPRPATEDDGLPTGDPRLDGLMAAIRGGSSRALGCLMHLCWEDLVRYAARQLGDVELARDIVQEVFIQVWERRRGWRPRGSARAYLYRIVRHLVIDEKRKQGVRRRWAESQQWADVPRPATPAGTAQVLGTRFHLAADAEELSVAVIEGRVALAGPDHEVQVGAGQATRLLSGLPEPVGAAESTGSMADWLDGFLIFHDTPLGVAMEEVEARYGTDVVIRDDTLTNQTLTMWFDSKSLAEVMTVVCSVIDARCSIDSGVVRIESVDRGAAW